MRECREAAKLEVLFEFADGENFVSFLIFDRACRFELCFSGEKMVKTATAGLACPTEAERSQSHYSNGTNGEKSSTDGDNGIIDVFRWSRCKKPLPQELMLSIGIPLPLENVEVCNC